MISDVQNSKTTVKHVNHVNELREDRNKIIPWQGHASKCLKEMRTL